MRPSSSGVLSRGCVAAVAVGLVACAPRGPEQHDEIEDDVPVSLPSTTSGLPQRTLPEGTASSVAAPLSLTASDGTGLRLVSLKARAVVQDPLAFTELHLVFDNPEDRTIEGRFSIDLPPGAAISRFAMKIADAWQEGEVVPRQTAQRVYEDFLHRRQDPALLENDAGNRFAARVFPIPARGRKELIVSYSQEITSSTDPYRLLLRGLPELDELDARIVGGSVVEVREAHYTPDRDLELPGALAPASAAGIRSGGLAVARIPAVGAMPPDPLSELTILFDTSASRALGFEGQVHRLVELVAELRARQGDFPLRVVAFDQDASLLFDGNASGFGDDARDRIYSRRPLGASDPARALRLLANTRGSARRVLIMTDGISTAGESELADLTEAVRKLKARGTERLDAMVDGGLQDRKALAALTTAGLPRDGIVADARLGVPHIVDKLLRATSSGVQVEVEGSTFCWPRTLDGVQPGDEVLVFAELPPGAAMRVVLTGDDTVRTQVPLTDVPRPLLARAIAGARIEALTAQWSALDPAEEKLRARWRGKIVALSTKHRVLSDFTALLVLETEADYARFELDRRALSNILVVQDDHLGWLRRSRAAIAGARGTGQELGELDSGVPVEPRDVPPQMARNFDPDMLQRNAGVLGMMQQESGHFLASPYGGALAVGSDDEDVWGGLTGKDVGDSFGVGGLGLVGTGRGGGGVGEGTIGLGNVGLIGRGSGSGYARGAGAGFGGRGKRVPIVRMAKAQVRGPLDRDIVRRIVRAHINEVRYCYNQGLTRDPGLKGRVSIQFTVGPTGAVPVAVVSQTTLADRDVSQCVAKAVKRWKFPRPRDAGNVVVTYPFVFTPGTPPRPLTPEEQRAAEAADAVERERAAEWEAARAEAERTARSPYAGRMHDVMALVDGEDQDAALSAALHWTEEAPGDALALIALGQALSRRGQHVEAARAYGSLVDLFPSRADLRRHAGQRLQGLGPAFAPLAADIYEKAVAQRPDHPSGHRLLAYARLQAGDPAAAFDAIVAGAARPFPSGRYKGVDRILREDVGLVAAAWIASDPALETAIRLRVAAAGATIPAEPSTRVVMSWETDVNDVDLHVYDGEGNHASYSQRALPTGGELYADVTTGYGPECFTIEGTPSAGPYRFEANYYARGPMGYGMGTLQTLTHDGQGGLRFQDRPFLVMKDQATVDLGTFGAEPQ